MRNLTLYKGFGLPAVEAQTASMPFIFIALGSSGALVGRLKSAVPPHDFQTWVAVPDEDVNVRKLRQAFGVVPRRRRSAANLRNPPRFE